MKKKRFLFGGGAIVVLALIGILSLGGSDDSTAELVYANVERGPMVVDILEAASVESSDSQVVKSEVEGQTTIISIIPEGTILTDDDVTSGRVLVELDSAELRERKTQQEITVQSEQASFTDAKESFEIQKNENESNLKAGELKIKFALMDIQKYLGETAAAEFVAGSVTLETLLAGAVLGGDALLEIHTRQNAIALATEDVKRAQVKLGWTEKLLEKGYKTRDEFEADQLSLKRLTVDLDKRKSELDLYVKYEFPKQAEKLRSDYSESERELERIEARNRAQLSKAEARLKSNEATYKQQVERLEKIDKQIANCVIKATKTGMVVYAGGGDMWRNDAEIIEGASVRERQELIKIPNALTMVAKARIHESVITSVKPGLPAEVTIDALPGRKFTGQVQKVALLPDSQNRWMNPNLKVYTTEVLIQGESAALKPGMSAQVRIIINKFDDVIKVPVQAVTAEGNQRIVFVQNGSKPAKRIVEVGDYNDKFMTVKSGLKPGERVVLNPNMLLDTMRPKISPDRDIPETAVAQGEQAPAAAGDGKPAAEGAPAADTGTRSVPGGGEAPAVNAGGGSAPGAGASPGGGQVRQGRGQRPPRTGGQSSGGGQRSGGQTTGQ